MIFEVAVVTQSTFRNTLDFFNKLGVYDVILPFLLVFTLVFAMLEKTKIFGLEPSGMTRKNLNAMTAFVSAFFVVASTQLVAILSEVMANVVLLLLLSVCFLLLVGSFHTGAKEFSLIGTGWDKAFMWIMFIGIILIFLNAFGWLQLVYEYVFFRFDSVAVSSIIVMVVLIGFIFFITKDSSKAEEKKKD